jgi:hypothetical protein
MWICVCVCEIGIFKERYECVCVRESVCERVWVHVRKLVIRECGRVGVACISPSRHAHTLTHIHIHIHLHTYTYTYTHTRQLDLVQIAQIRAQAPLGSSFASQNALRRKSVCMYV